MRRLGMTRVFGNPGSTEIPFLTDFPDDSSSCWACTRAPSSAWPAATRSARGGRVRQPPHRRRARQRRQRDRCARDNRVPLVIVVGQQDRRQLALGPSSRGATWSAWRRLPGLVDASRARHRGPGAIARAGTRRPCAAGPRSSSSPWGDWEEPLGDEWAGPAAPARLLTASVGGRLDAVAELAAAVRGLVAPALVVGAGADTPAGWAAVVALAERLECPVWQDTFSSRHGLPGRPPAVRRAPAVAAERTARAVRGPRSRARHRHARIPAVPVRPGPRRRGDDARRRRRATTRGRVAEPVRARAARGAGDGLLGARGQSAAAERRGPAIERPAPPEPPGAGEPLRTEHVIAALAARLPEDAILVEEAPSTRPELLARMATRAPLGFVAVANGALGFGLAAPIGLRLALPDRPVLALLGDGSSTYSVQALWSAARYGAGVVFVIGQRALRRDGRARSAHGAPGAWPVSRRSTSHGRGGHGLPVAPDRDA